MKWKKVKTNDEMKMWETTFRKNGFVIEMEIIYQSDHKDTSFYVGIFQNVAIGVDDFNSRPKKVKAFDLALEQERCIAKAREMLDQIGTGYMKQGAKAIETMQALNLESMKG